MPTGVADRVGKGREQMVKGFPRSGRIAGLLLGTVLAASILASGAAAGAVPAGVPAVPSPGSTSRLNGVFCPSATSCWAVGSYFSAGHARLDEALHWSGSKWARVAVPSPGGTTSGDESELLAGRCALPGNCWAVGDYVKNGADLDLMLHWNGTQWSQVTVPSPGGARADDISTLFDVACRSSSACWAAGDYGIENSTTDVLSNDVLRWNGTKWSKVTVPNPAGTANDDVNSIGSIRCPADNDCWAVGAAGTVQTSFTQLNEVLHWDGSTWARVTVPQPGGTANGDFNDLIGLTCTSSANCWAAGFYGSTSGNGTTFLNQILHWDGTSWAEATVPQPGGTSTGATQEITGAFCTSSSNCWAVGSYGGTSGGVGYTANEALQWNGSTWAQVTTPDPGGTAADDFNRLDVVHCATPSVCWAVGSAQVTGGPELNQALRWNGSTWSTG
jgi:hypothetical protein